MEEIPSNLHRMDTWTRGETFAPVSSSRLPAPILVPIRSQTKIQTIWTWSPEEESLLDIPFKLHAIFNPGSVQFVSLVPPQGHQVLHTWAVAVSPFFWLNTFSQRIWRKGGYEEMKDNSNSLESSSSVTWLSNSAPEDYTLVSVTCRRRPAWPRSAGVVVCQFSAVTAAPEDLFHIATPFNCVPPAQLLTSHIHFHHREKHESRGGRSTEK